MDDREMPVRAGAMVELYPSANDRYGSKLAPRIIAHMSRALVRRSDSSASADARRCDRCLVEP